MLAYVVRRLFLAGLTALSLVSVLVGGRIIVTGTPDAVSANPAVRVAYLGDAA